MLTEEMITEIVNGLVNIFENSILQIILYGSVARKQDTEESDIDIAIVLNKEFTLENRAKFIEWIAELDLKYDRVFSVVDIEQEKYEKWRDILPFYKNIQNEGVVLWKAA